MEETIRLGFLRESVRQNPEDVFARYGLALELLEAQPEEAWVHFEYLLSRHPEYSATYYQAGMFLLHRGRPEEARKVLTQGIEVTRQQGKRHAMDELQAALDAIQEDI